MGQLQQAITQIEQHVLGVAGKWNSYQRLQELPGIGKILGLTIALETGDAQRFAGAGNYASYCRCVKSLRQSNGKKKGENNRKCGNRYLAWRLWKRRTLPAAMTSVAGVSTTARPNKPIRSSPPRRWPANWPGRWHVMKENVSFDADRVFGPGRKEAFGETGREPAKGSGRKSPQD